jgi:hypothetical protein
MLAREPTGTFWASQKTLDELSQTRNGTLREDLLEYALGFVNPG